LGLRWRQILLSFEFGGYNSETITYKATKLQRQLAIACFVLSESWLKIPFNTIFFPKQK
jgi:hypothetical protein